MRQITGITVFVCFTKHQIWIWTFKFIAVAPKMTEDLTVTAVQQCCCAWYPLKAAITLPYQCHCCEWEWSTVQKYQIRSAVVLKSSLSTEGWSRGDAKLCIATDRMQSVIVYYYYFLTQSSKQLVGVSDKGSKVQKQSNSFNQLFLVTNGSWLTFLESHFFYEEDKTNVMLWPNVDEYSVCIHDSPCH